jgi:hypothetical protein
MEPALYCRPRSVHVAAEGQAVNERAGRFIAVACGCFVHSLLLRSGLEAQIAAIDEVAAVNTLFALVGHVGDESLEAKLASDVSDESKNVEGVGCVGHTYYISRNDQDFNAFL